MKSGELLALNGVEGKSLADHIAVTIGNLGENVTLRRATCLNTQNTGLNIMGLTHPSNLNGTKFLFGKYGSIIIYRKKVEDEKINQQPLESTRDEILRQMCQHIIGNYDQLIFQFYNIFFMYCFFCQITYKFKICFDKKIKTVLIR